MDLLSHITVFAYLTVLGLHRYYKRGSRPEPPLLDPKDYPTVTVQLPIFNEYYVAARVIESIGKLDYPRELLTVQILDDSTDRTQEITRAAARKLKEKGVKVQHIHRDDRAGFKAGALKFGLEHTNDELTAVG